MARDLHDLVIQRLFAAGMSAQALLARLNDPELTVRARTIVDELDETIREIRTVIFGLQSPLVADRRELRDEVLAVIDQERPALGLAPHVRFDGALETVDAAVGEHLLAILREALSNAARHAHAASVTVEVALIDDRVVLRVSDDGIGLTLDSPHGNGVRNMSSRAAATGGTFEVRPGQDGGTVLECRLPITAPVA
jgi:signal transduction histidine kinase